MENMAWLAGIIEGEGTFAGGGEYGSQLRVAVAMTDEDTVRKVCEDAGLGVVYGPMIRLAPRKPIWSWQTNGTLEAVKVMTAVYPLLGNRRRARVEQLIAQYLAAPPRGGNHVKTRCPRGHVYDMKTRRKRYCRICDNEQQRGRWKGVDPDRAECARGHALTPENTFISRGVRQCKKCRTGRPKGGR